MLGRAKSEYEMQTTTTTTLLTSILISIAPVKRFSKIT